MFKVIYVHLDTHLNIFNIYFERLLFNHEYSFQNYRTVEKHGVRDYMRMDYNAIEVSIGFSSCLKKIFDSIV